MQQKRLLMISTDRKIFEKGSAVRARQVEYAKEWGEVHIIVAAGKSFSEIHIAPNIWVYPSRYLLKIFYPLATTSLGRFIISRRGITDITCQDPFLTAMSGIALKKEFNIPLEIQIHTDIGSPNFGYNISNKIRKTLALSYLPKADRIRVVSNKIKDYLTGPLDIETAKITVKPIAVDVEKIKNAPILANADLHKKYPQFEKIILMASRLEKEKNVGLAIRAWVEVIKKVPKAGLIIVGSGSSSTRSDLGQSSRLNPSIIFESWIDQPTLFSYYKTADLFLNTSLFEGYGMTLVEAHAAGCKIVSTDVGVAKEVGAKIVGWEEREVVEGVVEGLNVKMKNQNEK